MIEKIESKIVDELKELQPSNDDIEKLEVFLKAIADPTRLKIILTIAAATRDAQASDIGICVYDIAQAVKMSQSAVSHQLRVLRYADLIKKEKQGKNVFYSLSDDHVTDIIFKSLAHIHESI